MVLVSARRAIVAPAILLASLAIGSWLSAMPLAAETGRAKQGAASTAKTAKSAKTAKPTAKSGPSSAPKMSNRSAGPATKTPLPRPSRPRAAAPAVAIKKPAAPTTKTPVSRAAPAKPVQQVAPARALPTTKAPAMATTTPAPAPKAPDLPTQAPAPAPKAPDLPTQTLAPAPKPTAAWAGALPMPATSPVRSDDGASAPPSAQAPATKPVADFKTFVRTLWPDAEKRGVSRATYDSALEGVTYDPATERLTHGGQSEFVTPIWDYLASSVAPLKISQGKTKALKLKETLDRIESDFGIPREMVLAVWGIESGYGALTGNRSTIRVLATLAFLEYRGDLFRNELLKALEILQSGDVAPAHMRGSWAGAMGQTQFMPSSFLRYAVDYDGDGRRDIWNDVPDALASTANFLKSEGWASDQPWGFEVVLPKDFDASHNEQTTFKPMSEWQARGVARPAGIALPQKGSAALLIPAGLHGPAFLVTPNFKVIKAYNASTSYALAVALLSERIAGHPPLSGTWPKYQKSLGVAQVRELQRRLKQLGFDVGELDGMVGERVRDAILAYEAKKGLEQDGVAVPAILEKVRAER